MSAMTTDTHPLKLYRKAEGLTQDGLAGKLGVSRTSVARWETGRDIDIDLVPRVSEITGIPIAELRPDLARLLQSEAAE